MPSTSKHRRLAKLTAVPLVAGLDHRLFLDEQGQDIRLKSLSHQERRRLSIEAKKLAVRYKKKLQEMSNSGVGYPVDKLLRELCIEYTNRYANAGIYSQPVNFNYFEAFCNIDLLKNTIAPYAEPASEYNHLFNIVDFLDYATSSDSDNFHLSQLLELPEKRIFHFTTNGDLWDFTFLAPSGREFIVSGFSLVRHECRIHWYLLGGEVLSDQEWDKEVGESTKLTDSDVQPYKRAFLNQSILQNNSEVGEPVTLGGTKTAIRTIIAGEINLKSLKHEGRCYMTERANSFNVTCDDPDVLASILSQSKREDIIEVMRKRIEQASVLWDLAEIMFKLPSYFTFKIPIEKTVLVASGQSVPRQSRGGRGIGVRYRRVSAIDITRRALPVVADYTTIGYEIETEGFWRRLSRRESYGRGPNGEPVRGRTWIKFRNKWRERLPGSKIIYVKSSVAAAKITAEEIMEAASKVEVAEKSGSEKELAEWEKRGVLYVLRCTVMKEGVYKVGWTSGTAEERAIALSSATGVPSAFVVVDYWHHSDPEGLEASVHAILDPYRINDRREFFSADYITIKRLIEAEIERVNGG